MWTANLSTYMKDINDIKEAIISYGMISEHVRQLLKTWSSRNWITLNDWLQLILLVLEYIPQL